MKTTHHWFHSIIKRCLIWIPNLWWFKNSNRPRSCARCPQTKVIDCVSCPQTKVIDCDSCPEIKVIDCASCPQTKVIDCASCPQTKVIDCLVCQQSADQGYWLSGLPVVHRPRLLTARFASCPQTKVIDCQVCQLSADQGYITTTVLCLENHNNIIFRLILILLMNILQSKDLVNFLCITFQIRVYYVDLIYCFHKFLIILRNIIRYIIHFFLIYCFAYII